jgi:hypothetical protein
MSFVQKNGQSKRVMASLAMLVSWEVWKEINACVFRYNYFTVDMVVSRIKNEIPLWVLARAKTLGNVIPRELDLLIWILAFSLIMFGL